MFYSMSFGVLMSARHLPRTGVTEIKDMERVGQLFSEVFASVHDPTSMCKSLHADIVPCSCQPWHPLSFKL